MQDPVAGPDLHISKVSRLDSLQYGYELGNPTKLA